MAQFLSQTWEEQGFWWCIIGRVSGFVIYGSFGRLVLLLARGCAPPTSQARVRQPADLLLILVTHPVTSLWNWKAKNGIREGIRKKYGIIWEFFPNSGPPPPPPSFGNPSSKKKIYGLFCVLGPKEHFWFLQKCSLFVSILTYTFGNRGPPPFKKNSQIIPFLPIFFGINRPRPKIQLH